MERKIPTVWYWWDSEGDWGQVDGIAGERSVRVDSPAWFAWLEVETTTRFAYGIFDRRAGYIRGFMTVRKERRQRGGGYWVAYQRVKGQLRKAYVGRSSGVTRAKLEQIAQDLLGKEVATTEHAEGER